MVQLARDGEYVKLPMERTLEVLAVVRTDSFDVKPSENDIIGNIGLRHSPRAVNGSQETWVLFLYSRWGPLSTCMWALRIFPSLPGSRLCIAMQVQHNYDPSTNGRILLTHVLTLSATDARINFMLDNNRTHDFRSSRCAGYLLDHSGDEGWNRL